MRFFANEAQRKARSPVVSVQITAGTATDVGKVRALNEDSLLSEYPVFLVADGMGGHSAGDEASAEVVAAFRPLVGRDDVRTGDVESAIAVAQQRVQDLSVQHRNGAGSTVAGAVVVFHDGLPHWLVFNMGDSRVYRLLGSAFDQITKDHSMVQELIDQGKLSPEEALRSVGRNVITRAVGAVGAVPDYWLMPVVSGERLLLCSDGLTNEVADERVKASLTLSGGTQKTADSLLTQALDHGGRDNVTVLVVDVVSGGAAPHGDVVSGDFVSASATVSTLKTAQTVPTERSWLRGAWRRR